MYSFEGSQSSANIVAEHTSKLRRCPLSSLNLPPTFRQLMFCKPPAYETLSFTSPRVMPKGIETSFDNTPGAKPIHAKTFLTNHLCHEYMRHMNFGLVPFWLINNSQGILLFGSCKSGPLDCMGPPLGVCAGVSGTWPSRLVRFTFWWSVRALSSTLCPMVVTSWGSPGAAGRRNPALLWMG